MRLFLCTLLFSVVGVQAQKQGLIDLSFEKDLIPEGIALDPQSEKVYLNSLRLNKIVRCDLDGSNTEEFLAQNGHGYLSGFGMTIKGDTLYALGNTLPKTNNKSVLLLMDVNSGDLIKSYAIDDPRFIYLNDIAVSSKGHVYITDSESRDSYTINRVNDTLEVFLSHDELKHCNGIAISDDDKLLYFASYTSGIRILDIATKKLLNQPNDHKGIDGMKFYRGSLIGMVNSKRNRSENGVYRFFLNGDTTNIIGNEKIFDFLHESDIPTTFAIHKDTLYFNTDSQLDNFNQDTNEIIDPSRLKPYQLIKVNLSNTGKHEN